MKLTRIRTAPQALKRLIMPDAYADFLAKWMIAAMCLAVAGVLVFQYVLGVHRATQDASEQIYTFEAPLGEPGQTSVTRFDAGVMGVTLIEGDRIQVWLTRDR